MVLNQKLQAADVMVVLCSYNLTVATYAAELFHKNMAPIVVFSGSEGSLTKGKHRESEARRFAQAAIEQGVPDSAILIEDKATNTGQNITFTAELLNTKGIHPDLVLLVQKPYMERRALATAEAQWPHPQPRFEVTSPHVSCDEYMQTTPNRDDSINRIVADLQRLTDYADKGWSTPQVIPLEVERAKNILIGKGYNRLLA